MRHFVEIKATIKKKTVVYRFYGRGEWEVNIAGKWWPANDAYVPAEVLKVAAEQAMPQKREKLSD